VTIQAFAFHCKEEFAGPQSAGIDGVPLSQGFGIEFSFCGKELGDS
jgi:hypothetical protein